MPNVTVRRDLSELTFFLDNYLFADSVPLLTDLIDEEELREVAYVTIPADQLLTLLCSVRSLCEGRPVRY